MMKWADDVAQVIKSARYTRVQKRELLQKSLNDLGPAVVGLINESTPISSDDVTTVVEETVKSVLAQQEVAHVAQLAALEAKIEALTEQAAMNEVKSLVTTSQRPIRKSLTNISPPAQQAASTDGIRKFSASEIARATVQQTPSY